MNPLQLNAIIIVGAIMAYGIGLLTAMGWKNKPRKEPQPPQVKCETCKHKLDREDCQEIPLIGFHGKYELLYYCPLHRKPYDSVVWGNPINGECLLEYYKTIPAHGVEVDEEGREINK